MPQSVLASHFVGVILTTAFYGVTLAQTWTYYRTYTNDPRHIKLFVALLCILDTSHLILATTSIYDYTVKFRGDLVALSHVSRPFLASMAVTSTIAFIVQLIYATRIWRLSFNNAYITSPIIILALTALASGAAMITKTIRDPKWAHTSINNLPASLLLSSTITCDILIASTQVWLFHRHKLGPRLRFRFRWWEKKGRGVCTDVGAGPDAGSAIRLTLNLGFALGLGVEDGDARADRREDVDVDVERGSSADSECSQYGRLGDLLTKLTVLVINVGLLTSIDALLFLILFLTCPQNGMFLVPCLLLSNCYVNSFLTTLNSRRALRELVDNQLHDVRGSFFDIPLPPHP